MLQAEEIKYVFNGFILRPGDILLMNTYHERQRKIMQCEYDHAAIYLGDAFIAEADGSGVVMRHMYSVGFKENSHGCVLRLKERNPATIETIMKFARAEMGKEYGTKEAYKVREKADTDEKESSNRTFCSRFVAQAYHNARIELVTNSDYCAPDDFLKSEKLYRLEDSVMEASDEIIPTVLHAQDERENGEAGLGEVFEAFSHLYGQDIQTYQQFLETMLQHPEKDNEAIACLNATGWFDTEKETKKHWPWFEDDDDFFGYHGSTERALYFIHNQFLHYDLTFLPNIRRNGIDASFIKLYNPQSRTMVAICDGWERVMAEAKRVRKRLEYLYLKVQERDPQGFKDFVNKNYFYKDYRYTEGVTDISHILKAALEVGLPPLTNQDG